MANAKTFPASLGYALLGDATEVDDGYESSEMEGGVLRQRQRYLNGTGRRSVRFYWTTFQAARARDFLARLGGASFDMTLDVPGDPDTSRPTVSVRYMGRFNHNPVDNRATLATFDVFIEAMPELQAEGYYEYYDELGAEFNAYWQALENLVNNYPA